MSRSSEQASGRSPRLGDGPFAYEEGVLRGRAAGAPDLAYALSLPGDAKAAVVVAHGYAEHMARYRRVLQRWAGKGVAAVVFDFRGHGLSQGPRGHVERFTDYHDDVDDILALFRPRIGTLPLFGFGHSNGGLIITTHALSRPSVFRALALTSPYFGLALQVPQAKIVLGKVASRLYPKLGVPSGLSGADLTHDAQIARAYDLDPLVNKAATARWFTESSAAQREVLERAPQLQMPVLLVAGGDDKVASTPAARAVFDRFGSTDKTFDARAGLFHEVLNEPQAGDEIADQIADFFLAHR